MRKTSCSRREFISAMLLVPPIVPLALSTGQEVEVFKWFLNPDNSSHVEQLRAERYIASMRVYANSYDTETFIVWKLYQSNGKLLLEKTDKPYVLNKGYNEVCSIFEIPKISEREIINNSNLQIFVSAESVFRNTGEGVCVEQLQIELDTQNS
ncbi:MAG TPA: hypothetical protein PLX23_12050 [Candidatus Hydrogenedens sp.]|nr:hypothetical protein [Candidatus Hydrogenedens sp.]